MEAVQQVLSLLLVAILAFSPSAEAAKKWRWKSCSLKSLFGVTAAVALFFGYRDNFVMEPLRSADRGERLQRTKTYFGDVDSADTLDIARRDVRSRTGSDLFMIIKSIRDNHPEMTKNLTVPMDSSESFAEAIATDYEAQTRPWDHSVHPQTDRGHYYPIARSRRAQLEQILFRYYFHLLAALEEREPNQLQMAVYPGFHDYPFHLQQLGYAREAVAADRTGQLGWCIARVYLMDRAAQDPELAGALLEQIPGVMSTGTGAVTFSKQPNGDILYSKQIGSPNHRAPSFCLRVEFGPDAEIYENHLEERLEEITEQWLLTTNHGSLWPKKAYAKNYKHLVDLYIDHLKQ